MKQYGNKKATEFNKRDLSPIYKMAKDGELKVEKWFMNELYDLAEYYGYDDNRAVEFMEKDVLDILKAEDKQSAIDEVSNKWFERLSKKAQLKAVRAYV